MSRCEPDFVDVAARTAFDLHAAGKIDDERLIALLEMCINTRAVENGYADKFGMPFPDTGAKP